MKSRETCGSPDSSRAGPRFSPCLRKWSSGPRAAVAAWSCAQRPSTIMIHARTSTPHWRIGSSPSWAGSTVRAAPMPSAKNHGLMRACVAFAPTSRWLSGRRLTTRTTTERFTPDLPAPLTANCSALDAGEQETSTVSGVPARRPDYPLAGALRPPPPGYMALSIVVR